MDNPVRFEKASIFRVLTVIALAVLMSANVSAESVATINGVDIDSTTLDLYLESRTQKPVEQITPEERDIVFKELIDIYLLTTQPQA